MENIKGQTIKDIDKGHSDMGEMASFKVSMEKTIVLLNKRAVRISASFFLMVDLLKDNSELAQAIVKDSISLTTTPVVYDGSDIGTLKKMIIYRLGFLQSLSGLLQLGKLTGRFSLMNSKIVGGELKDILSEYRDFLGSISKGLPATQLAFSEATRFELPKDFFGIVKPANEDSKTKKDVKEIVIVNDNDKSNNEELKPQLEKVSSNEFVVAKPIVTVRNKQRSLQQERTVKIVGLLARLGEVNIKDITQELPHVSEKTIQRDLARMIKEGKVITEGKRRWTKYSLA